MRRISKVCKVSGGGIVTAASLKNKGGPNLENESIEPLLLNQPRLPSRSSHTLALALGRPAVSVEVKEYSASIV